MSCCILREDPVHLRPIRPPKIMKKPHRRLHRFYSPHPLKQAGQTLLMTPAESLHMTQSLRLGSSDLCLLFDPSSTESLAQIRSVTSEGKVEIEVVEILEPNQNTPLYYLRVFVGIPQKGKMDYLIEKAQECGVDEVFPMETERTVVKMSASNKDKVVSRWNRITLQAAKQSGSLKLSQIHKPQKFDQITHHFPPEDACAVFHPVAGAIAFNEWVQSLKHDKIETAQNPPVPPFLNLFIGPEGGFAEGEIHQLIQLKAQVVTLGKTIMKVDTAFVGIIAALRMLGY